MRWRNVPTPFNSFHPRVSDWVIQKALQIKHCIGITCESFVDELLALLTAIEAGYAQSKANSSRNMAKKSDGELKKLMWAMNDEGGERSSN